MHAMIKGPFERVSNAINSGDFAAGADSEDASVVEAYIEALEQAICRLADKSEAARELREAAEAAWREAKASEDDDEAEASEDDDEDPLTTDTPCGLCGGRMGIGPAFTYVNADNAKRHVHAHCFNGDRYLDDDERKASDERLDALFGEG